MFCWVKCSLIPQTLRNVLKEFHMYLTVLPCMLFLVIKCCSWLVNTVVRAECHRSEEADPSVISPSLTSGLYKSYLSLKHKP